MGILSNNKNFQSTLEFPDNRLMIDLCGQLDTNLSKIEHEIPVHIFRRGNQFEISGKQDECRLAATVLQSLYSHLESGKVLEPGDVDATIRMPNKFFDSDFMKEQILDENAKLSQETYEISTRKKTILPRTFGQKKYVKNLLNSDLTFGVGPAGTGKTYIAIAVGVSMYLNGAVDKIILTRPAVEAGERLGFLPGDMKEKVDPYMQPLLYLAQSAFYHDRLRWHTLHPPH